MKNDEILKNVDKLVEIYKKGDVILIDKKEIYYWDGNCKIIMICTPAWYKEQCKLLEDIEE